MRGTLGVLLLAACVAAGGASSELWQSPAKLHRFLRKSVRGTLIVNKDDLEFRSPRFTKRWAFPEIHTFNLSLRELTLTTYKNRPWHEPGVRRYRFTLGRPIPSAVAATLAARVAKPARNGVPVQSAAALAEPRRIFVPVSAAATERCASGTAASITSLRTATTHDPGAGPTSRRSPVPTLTSCE